MKTTIRQAIALIVLMISAVTAFAQPGNVANIPSRDMHVKGRLRIGEGINDFYFIPIRPAVGQVLKCRIDSQGRYTYRPGTDSVGVTDSSVYVTLARLNDSLMGYVQYSDSGVYVTPYYLAVNYAGKTHMHPISDVTGLSDSLLNKYTKAQADGRFVAISDSIMDYITPYHLSSTLSSYVTEGELTDSFNVRGDDNGLISALPLGNITITANNKSLRIDSLSSLVLSTKRPGTPTYKQFGINGAGVSMTNVATGMGTNVNCGTMTLSLSGVIVDVLGLVRMSTIGNTSDVDTLIGISKADGYTKKIHKSSLGFITDGNTGWDNSYGFITDGNIGWDNSYNFITDGNTNWDNSYGFLTSQTSHADVVQDGDFTSAGLMKRGASAGTYSIITDNSANWNTAFGWGNHASLYWLKADTSGTLASKSYLQTYTGNRFSPLSHSHSGVYQPVGSYLTAETDPSWSSEKSLYLVKADSINKYITPTQLQSELSGFGSVDTSKLVTKYDAFKLTNTTFGLNANAASDGNLSTYNIAIGPEALRYNNGSSNNIAIGNQTLRDHMNGNGMIAIGDNSMPNNGEDGFYPTGYSTALGIYSGFTGANMSFCTFLGALSGMNDYRDRMTYVGVPRNYMTGLAEDTTTSPIYINNKDLRKGSYTGYWNQSLDVDGYVRVKRISSIATRDSSLTLDPVTRELVMQKDASGAEADPVWISDSNEYYKKTYTDNHFQVKGDYVTGTPWTALGYITDGNTGWNNSYGFITGETSHADVLVDGDTATTLASKSFLSTYVGNRFSALSHNHTGVYAPVSHTQAISTITGLQDSLTNHYTKTQSDAKYVTGTPWTSAGYLTANQSITLSGDASGTGTTSITVAVADDSHNHVISNVDNLQTSLDAKADTNNIKATAGLASDHTATGVKVKLTATATSAIGDVVYIAGTGKATFCKADAIDNCPYALAICATASIAANASGDYLTNGTIRDDTWNWTVGGLIYISITGTTGNTLTQTAPSATNNVVMAVGVALSADVMYFYGSMIPIELN